MSSVNLRAHWGEAEEGVRCSNATGSSFGVRGPTREFTAFGVAPRAGSPSRKATGWGSRPAAAANLQLIIGARLPESSIDRETVGSVDGDGQSQLLAVRD